MTKRKVTSCPCGRGSDYRTCCQPFHRGAEPDAPDDLVRARFAAFALGDDAYLTRTLHPEHELMREPRDAIERQYAKARRGTRYRRVDVHDVQVDGDAATVRFTARIFVDGRDRSFTEISRFARSGGAWRYLDGTIDVE